MQYFDLAQLSLAKAPSSVTELYIPLWVADGNYAGAIGGSAPAYQSGQQFLTDGGGISSSATSATKIHTFNASWGATTKVAFECTLQATASYTAYAALWDMTSSAVVSSSQVSTTSTTFTVVRSPQITLTPGHQYGVTIWTANSSSATVNISDAHLIVFP